MTYAPTTHRVREPYDGPRRHDVTVETQNAGGYWRKQQIIGGDAVTIAFLRALADELEKGTVTT